MFNKSEVRMPRIRLTTETFVARAKEIHKDGDNKPLYDYNKTKFEKTSKKVIITCKTHGDFEQTPNNHLANHGCKKCAVKTVTDKQKLSHDEFIKKCEEKHPNLLDYKDVVYENYTTPCIFYCKICSTKITRPPSHMLGEGRGHGCAICNGGIADTKETFLEKAIQKHGTKFSYDHVLYINAITHVNIQCNTCEFCFPQTPNHHLSGNGCPKCAGKEKTHDEFIQLSKQKFGDSTFDYSKCIFINMKTDITLICNKMHEFTTTPEVHLRLDSKGGCKTCHHENMSIERTYTKEEWIEAAKIKHNNIYDYSNVDYKGSQYKVIICCIEHGPFEQLPPSHLSGAGCRLCANDKIRDSKLLTDQEINALIAQATDVHNNKYTDYNIYRNNDRLYIKMICPNHGNIIQRLDHHMNGHGCKNCTSQISKAQLEWLRYISISKSIIYGESASEYCIPNTKFKADGYCAETKTIYEFHGDFWHGNPRKFSESAINPITKTTFGELYQKTCKRTKQLEDLGYTLIEIWESDWTNAKRAVIKLQQAFRRSR